MLYYSPLRYPGGKRRLANFFKLIFHYNGLLDGEYAEPFAGGASIALALLYDEYVRKIYINDLDQSIYAFWYSVLNKTDMLCKKIYDTPVTFDEWCRQKCIQNDLSVSLFDLGFSTFFLNRTNHSGIISGGIIGGKHQSGKWKLNARYNKSDLIGRIKKIARYKNRIYLYNLDSIDFIHFILPRIPKNTLFYLDPPYFIKGQQQLYTNFYEPKDHQAIAKLISSITHGWVVSYDNIPVIRMLYKDFTCLNYNLYYSAQDRYQGSEIMFFNRNLIVPDVINPVKIKNNSIQQYLF